MNRADIIGRLGSDPETKSTAGGNTVCRLSVATSESYVDKDGQKQTSTQWHKVVVWGKLAELCGRYLEKGRQVFVSGRMETRSWEDNQGVKKYITEIIANQVEFLGKSEKSDSNEEMPF